MIKVTEKWSIDPFAIPMVESLAQRLGYMPGMLLGQDPGTFVQIRAEEQNGTTVLAWDFGSVNTRVLASGYLEGVRLEYMVGDLRFATLKEAQRINTGIVPCLVFE